MAINEKSRFLVGFHPLAKNNRVPGRFERPNVCEVQGSEVLRQPVRSPSDILAMSWVGAHARDTKEVVQLATKSIAMLPRVVACCSAGRRFGLGLHGKHS
jgi:hypothetical protein